jgi:outer membrane biosynthesis protein TonB
MRSTHTPKPSRQFAAASALALVGGFCFAQQQSQNSSAPAFESAELVSATDIPYPMQSIAIGTVVVEAIVTETGSVEGVFPIREIESLTEVALDSVRNWQFIPALLGGKPVKSRTTVAVTFNPAAIPAANVPLPPLFSMAQSCDGALQPQPVDVLAASFVQYPINSIASGAVVLRLTIDKAGNVKKTLVVRRVPSLTSPAIRALREWRFKAAAFAGKPVDASIALAFVLRPPLPGPSVR